MAYSGGIWMPSIPYFNIDIAMNFNWILQYGLFVPFAVFFILDTFSLVLSF